MIARELSFTRAAASLGYVQSSVTAQIQSLERELGAPLFERLGRKVTLTDAGRRLLEYADRILALNEEARSSVAGRGEVAGTLTIGAPDTLCAYRLPAVLASFRRQFPSVHVAFHPARSCKHGRRAVADGLVDAAILLDEHVEQQGRVVTEVLAPEPLCLLVAPDHPLAGLDTISLRQLHGIATVMTETGCGYRDLFERLLADAGVALGSTAEFASIEAIKECVKAGMGLTVLPRIAVATELDQGTLVELAWDGPPLEIVTQVIRHKDKWLSPTLSAFLDCVRDELRPVGSTNGAAPHRGGRQGTIHAR